MAKGVIERPASLDDVAGQSAAVEAVRRVLDNNGGDPGGTAWYITGDSGTGKTTIAEILAAMMGGEHGVKAVPVQQLTPARVDELEAQTSSPHLFGKWAVIVNECHGLREDTLRRLKDALDTGVIPRSVVWIFTTTMQEQAKLYGSERSEDAVAFVSRCIELQLDNGAESREQRALHVRNRAIAAGVDGFPESDYLRAMHAVKGNTRMLWQDVLTGNIAKRAKMCLESVAVPVAQKRLSKLPDEETLRGMTTAQLRPLALEHGFAAGWVASASQASLVAKLVAKGAK